MENKNVECALEVLFVQIILIMLKIFNIIDYSWGFIFIPIYFLIFALIAYVILLVILKCLD